MQNMTKSKKNLLTMLKYSKKFSFGLEKYNNTESQLFNYKYFRNGTFKRD